MKRIVCYTSGGIDVQTRFVLEQDWLSKEFKYFILISKGSVPIDSLLCGLL